MTDRIYVDFLERQETELGALCAASSRLECKPIRPDAELPANIFMVKMDCAHLIMVDDQVQRAGEPCLIAIQLPADYVRRAYSNPGQILSLVAPRNCWQPNIFWPHICAGPIAPGTPVVELVLRCYEILTYNKFTPREDDCLNRDACRWARAHMSQFPLERRPLRDVPAIQGTSDSLDFVLEPAVGGPTS